MNLKAPILSLLLSLFVATAHADLTPLADDELGAWEGQSGADVAWLLQLNHSPWVNDSLANAPTLSSDCQTYFEFCRLAIQFNNRSMNSAGTAPQYDNAGRKVWLVFKGVQGTINIPQLRLEGTDITYTNDSSASETKGAVQLTFTNTQPVQIRNFGFDALAIEVDSAVGANDGPLAKTSGTGFSNGKYTTPGFDNGRETGFLGLRMQGNLAVGGKMYMFGCSVSHPRC